ncbi:hypothetical protein F4859DRAFT_179492 [Xylaria cf. heliscus]|nr:hypothetical protein F4859DRAFT_179492 [Xylaria cf. heliscus]
MTILQMENEQSSITWFPRQEFSGLKETRDTPDLYQLKEPVEDVDSLGLGAEAVEEAEISHIGKDSSLARTLNGSLRKRNEKTQTRESLLIEEDFYTLFEDCVPTDERLRNLRQRWIDRSHLQRRLLYCRPFHIVFEEQQTSRTALWARRSKGEPVTRLVRKSQHELGEFLQEENSESFAEQLLEAWPASFGQLISVEGQPQHFLWQLGAPQADDALIVCRKPLADNQDLLMVEVLLGPSDNVLWQILPNITNSIMSMRTIAFLESLFAPTQSNFTSLGTISDWFPVQNTTPALHSTGDFGRGDWLCIQFNMRVCIPDETGFRVRRFSDGWGISPKGIGFPLQRQAAKIPDLARGTTQFAVEFLLSVSIVLKKRHRDGAPSALNYNTVVWLDYNTKFKSRTGRCSNCPMLSDRVGLDLGLEDCGAGGEGFYQFLIVLTRIIDHWRKCWDTMMDKIDEIISVQLQDTLDRKRWSKLMFDDSFQLSAQYFTVLQLLRIFQNWIGETERGVQSLGEELVEQCELWQSWRQKHAEMDEVEWPLDMETLRTNIGKVDKFFELQVTPLKERIEKKKEEVTSLQDAV